MKSTILLVCILVSLLLGWSMGAHASEEGLDLDEAAADAYGYYGTYGDRQFGNGYGYGGYNRFSNYGNQWGGGYGGVGLGYGMGGYGDPTSAPYSLNVCRDKNQEDCTANYPDSGSLEWRFIPNLGWRKFTHFGALRKDWWDFKKTVPWPYKDAFDHW